jgi:hypothetical protein
VCIDGANTGGGGEGVREARSGGQSQRRRAARVGHRGVLLEKGRRDVRRQRSGQLRRGCRSDAACPFEVIMRRRGEGRGRGAREAGGDLHRMPDPCRWRRGERMEGGGHLARSGRGLRLGRRGGGAGGGMTCG